MKTSAWTSSSLRHGAGRPGSIRFKARNSRFDHNPPKNKPKILYSTKELRYPHFQGPGNSHERVHGNILLSPLHVADVSGIQFSLFGELLLAEAKPLAPEADIFAQNAAMFWKGAHALNRNRNQGGFPWDIYQIFFLKNPCLPSTVTLTRMQYPNSVPGIFPKRGKTRENGSCQLYSKTQSNGVQNQGEVLPSRRSARAQLLIKGGSL
jgi:hypothetical protein